MNLITKIVCISLFASTLFLSGCQNPNLAGQVKLASYVATAEILSPAGHPEWRPKFELAVKQLDTLIASKELDLTTLLSIAHQLPVKELHSKQAVIIVTSTTLILEEQGVNAKVVTPEQVLVVAQAMRDGVNMALAQL